jgi:glucokinase
MRYAIGIDLGGTHIKGGLVDEAGRIHYKETRPTPPEGQTTPEAVVQAQIALGQDLQDRALGLGIQVEGVGFGQPNMIEGPDWIQRLANNVPGLEGFAMRPALAQAFGERIAMDNDVMNASFAEYHFGDGHNYQRAFLMFIGTGIAAGIFTEGGKQLRFVSGWTGDTGHIIVDPHGQPCTCGGRGCLETVATGPAIRQQALAAAQNGKSPALAARLAAAGDLNPQDAAEAALAGDEAASRIWEETGWFLGVALTSFIHIFDPHVILIGGGIAEAGDLLLEPIRRTIAALGSPYYLRHLQAVKKAALGADAGLIGAAALILAPEASR